MVPATIGRIDPRSQPMLSPDKHFAMESGDLLNRMWKKEGAPRLECCVSGISWPTVAQGQASACHPGFGREYCMQQVDEPGLSDSEQ
jgi:hypothetical protein